MAELIALVCDVDGTLLGDDASLAAFASWYEQRRSRVKLAYNSGRFINSVRASIRSTALPEPDAVIGGVGTEIELAGRDRLAAWPPVSRWSETAIDDIVVGVSGACPQPTAFQSTWKRSFYLHDASIDVLGQLRASLAERVDAEMVYSSSRDLDVLPAKVNKGAASVRLLDYWGISHSRAIVAGDSLNDAAMLQPPFRPVVVANADVSLRSQTGAMAYFARLPFAAGVIEGAEHWLQELHSLDGSAEPHSAAIRRHEP